MDIDYMKKKDWCILSKETSRYVLKQIMGRMNDDNYHNDNDNDSHIDNNTKDDDCSNSMVVQNIHTYLEDLANKMRSNEIDLYKYCFRKKLEKHPDEYNIIKNNNNNNNDNDDECNNDDDNDENDSGGNNEKNNKNNIIPIHVHVAKRMLKRQRQSSSKSSSSSSKMKKKKNIITVGEKISYVICKKQEIKIQSNSNNNNNKLLDWAQSSSSSKRRNAFVLPIEEEEGNNNSNKDKSSSSSSNNNNNELVDSSKSGDHTSSKVLPTKEEDAGNDDNDDDENTENKDDVVVVVSSDEMNNNNDNNKISHQDDYHQQKNNNHNDDDDDNDENKKHNNKYDDNDGNNDGNDNYNDYNNNNNNDIENLKKRAYHIDEIKRSKGNLVPDVEWYLTYQIFYPVSHLCEPIFHSRHHRHNNNNSTMTTTTSYNILATKLGLTHLCREEEEEEKESVIPLKTRSDRSLSTLSQHSVGTGSVASSAPSLSAHSLPQDDDEQQQQQLSIKKNGKNIHLSAKDILQELLSIPTNQSCAECRALLNVDSIIINNSNNSNHGISANNNNHHHHHSHSPSSLRNKTLHHYHEDEQQHQIFACLSPLVTNTSTHKLIHQSQSSQLIEESSSTATTEGSSTTAPTTPTSSLNSAETTTTTSTIDSNNNNKKVTMATTSSSTTTTITKSTLMSAKSSRQLSHSTIRSFQFHHHIFAPPDAPESKQPISNEEREVALAEKNRSINVAHNTRKRQRVLALEDFRCTANTTTTTTTTSKSFSNNGKHRYNHHSNRKNNCNNKNRRLTRMVDPAIRARQLADGFGVFVCKDCSEAHKLLGTDISIVRSVHDPSVWSNKQIEFMRTCGGNAKSWIVYEAYVPSSWQKTYIPKPGITQSTLVEREIFVRAKYEALAFILPRGGGPLSNVSWTTILQNYDPMIERYYTQNRNLQTYHKLILHSEDTPSIATAREDSDRSINSGGTLAPTDRLVDYFCIIGHGNNLSSDNNFDMIPNIQSPNELTLQPQLVDCYPKPPGGDSSTKDGDEFPEHIATFVFPDGCRPQEKQVEPKFFTFVLTSSSGVRLYCAALQVYDTYSDIDSLSDIIEESGYKGILPPWLTCTNFPRQSFMNSDIDLAKCFKEDTIFLPKCLVVISHHPFFDAYRFFLLQLYRISLIKSTLPLERYIVNFVRECPLPPQGKVQVKFSFTNTEHCLISRPPVNKLPLVDFSFRPLFASLSVPNIMVVIGCLMQELPVALLCQNYAMLGPVAEALLSLLFPFYWQGIYLPVMPYSMIDILEAPVPFLVGLTSKYLEEAKPEYRPASVVFVDLDSDVVHLGFDDSGPRVTPALPEREAIRLKVSLEQCSSTAYVSAEGRAKSGGGIHCSITTGEGVVLSKSMREGYAQKASGESKGIREVYNQNFTATSNNNRLGRETVFANTDKAYWKNELVKPIEIDQGKVSEEPTAVIFESKENEANRNIVSKTPIVNRLACTDNLLDKFEPDGFSSEGIRRSFLRFFVTIFRKYKKFVVPGSQEAFMKDEFLAEMSHLSPNGKIFMESVVSSQMFQNFIETRLADPNEPEVLFFDESIDEKNNRSKVKTMKQGGKTVTYFLDDSSGEISETYTAVPPSDFGLHSSEARIEYSYESFPKLNNNLFGRIRLPKKWLETPIDINPLKKSFSKRPSVRALASQKEIYSKALTRQKSVSKQKNGIKHISDLGVKNLEYGIFLLAYRNDVAVSSPSLKKRSRRKKKSTKASEETLAASQKEILNALDLVASARRKAGILLEIIVEFQTAYRRFRLRKHYLSFKQAIIILQRLHRHQPTIMMDKAIVKRIILEKDAIIVIQRNIRIFMARLLLLQLRSALAIQCCIRSCFARSHFKRLRKYFFENKAAEIVQRNVRAYLSRQTSLRIRSAIIIQCCVRAFLARTYFFFWKLIIMERKAAECIQRSVRGLIARQMLAELRSAVIIQRYTRRFIAQERLAELLSAVAIQRCTRDFIGRKRLLELRSAVKIQIYARAFIERKRLVEQSAVKLQCYARAYLARSEISRLKYSDQSIQHDLRVFAAQEARSCSIKSQVQHAVLIQNTVRMFLARLHFSRQRDAARIIQQCFKNADTIVEQRPTMIDHACLWNSDIGLTQIQRDSRLFAPFASAGGSSMESSVQHVVLMQSIIRMFLARTYCLKRYHSARIIQRWFKNIDQIAEEPPETIDHVHMWNSEIRLKPFDTK